MNDYSRGVLPYQWIRGAYAAEVIRAGGHCESNQFQPASFDLRCSIEAYMLPGSFLPGDLTVREFIHQRFDAYLPLDDPYVMGVGETYLVKCVESLNLPQDIYGFANPKSSIGKLGVFVRLVTDKSSRFNHIPAGYCGPLWLQITPTAFPIVLSEMDRLLQIRFVKGNSLMNEYEVDGILDYRNVIENRRPMQSGMIPLTLNLKSFDGEPVGFKNKTNAPPVLISNVGEHDPHEYWEAIEEPDTGMFIMDPDYLYCLLCQEKLRFPPVMCSEMQPCILDSGEFRAHYAGFIDPGFGWDGNHPDEGEGAYAVIETRAYSSPFLMEHGQPVGWLKFHCMQKAPNVTYGQAGNNYQNQKLKLAKQFAPW